MHSPSDSCPRNMAEGRNTTSLEVISCAIRFPEVLSKLFSGTRLLEALVVGFLLHDTMLRTSPGCANSFVALAGERS